MPSPLRLLLIADIGGEQTRHIGDEAMIEANLDALRRVLPDATFTIVSRDPAWAAHRYGVASVPSFDFPRDPSASSERQSILAHLLDSPPERHAAIDAVATSDALIVSGGGNLCSTWPDLLYERVALLQLAHRLGKPAVVLGQTLGPDLRDDERRLLAASLHQVRFIGVRELPSAALAIELGIPHGQLWYQSDDALIVSRDQTNVSDDEPRASPGAESIAVTIDPQIRAIAPSLFSSLADQLRKLSETTGAPLALVPHAFGGEDRDVPSDLTEARLLAERIGPARVTIAENLDTRGTRRVTADAALVISSRYHPIVFGLAAGVPSVGIYGDDYCRIKLQGALAHARLERCALTYDEVARGALLETSLDLWGRRDQIRSDLAACMESWRVEWSERWTAVRAVLTGEALPIPPSRLFGRPADEVLPAVASSFSAQPRWLEEVLAAHEARCRETLPTELRPRRLFARYFAALRSRLRLF
jgi:polysaccharide pyruvyl transferase WcaK-like protein